MKIAFLAAILFGSLIGPTTARDIPPLLIEAPCSWFQKIPLGTESSLSPPLQYGWGSKHVIRLDTWAVVTGQLLVTPGLYHVDDGTDAFEFIERKCGRGLVPDGVYRAAMPLPFGLLSWYRY